MTVPFRTRVAIWSRAAGRCSFPGCGLDLARDASETDDEAIVGDIAHIVASSSDGPRGEEPLPVEQRDRFDNLLLLCKVHHKEVDDQPVRYSAVVLQKMKRDHERSVRSALSEPDQKYQQRIETYALYIDGWAERAHLEAWKTWTSMILSGEPRMRLEISESLGELSNWLLGRLWPGSLPELEDSLLNFRVVLDDLMAVFHRHTEEDAGVLWTRKFYQIQDWNPGVYHGLLREYRRHVALVEDLVLELTRAGNLVCDLVRDHIDPSFRVREGVLLVREGPLWDMSYRGLRTEYRSAERSGRPYPGLSEFERIRATRDISSGNGPDVD